MRFYIRPGKVTCAGIVVIMMVLPNSIWKGPDAKDAPVKPPVAKSRVERTAEPDASAVRPKLPNVTR